LAEKRMLSRGLIEAEDFLNLSKEAQCLYIHLNLNADDEGVLNNIGPLLRMVDCKDEAFDELIQTGYILPVIGNIFAITHWNINNTLSEKRKKKSIYVDVHRYLDLEDDVYKPKVKVC